MFFIGSVSAQDYGPVKVNLDGYIDDKAGETFKAAPVVEKKEEPKEKKVEAKKALSPLDARKAARQAAAEKAKSTSVARQTPKATGPISKVDSSSLTFGGAKSTGSNLILYIGVGVAVLLLLIIIVVVMMKKKKSSSSPYNFTSDSASLQDKIEASEKAMMADTQNEAPPLQSSDGNVGDANFVPHNSQEMAQKFANEMKVDQRGRNPSGLIIDEDMYFTSGATGFVDEDFDPQSE